MLRIIFFLIVIGMVALGAAWFADRPGEVALNWQGWQIETSLTVVLAALLAVIGLTMVGTAVWLALGRIPARRRERRNLRSYQAVSRGLVAIGAGDANEARKFADIANKLAPGDPLVLLLSAQTAQMKGDRHAAEGAFRRMAVQADTKLLGLRGLFVEAQRRADMVAARGYAEEAAKTAPGLSWAGRAVLEFRCAAGDWVGALSALERNAQAGLVDRAAYRRRRAVLMTAQALALEKTDQERAKTLALEAVKLEPTLVPAAVLAGRRLAESGDLRGASRIIERAWKANPHPDLADTYANLRFGDSARDRLARVETLAQKAPGDIESALAVAKAAFEAQEFAKARAALRPLLAQPTPRVALLMAQIERRDGDEGRAREWTARAVHAARDPMWTADGYVSDRWLPVSPVTGRLDAFEWKVPLAQLSGAGGVIIASAPVEPEARTPAAPAGAAADRQVASPGNGGSSPVPGTSAVPATVAPSEKPSPRAEDLQAMPALFRQRPRAAAPRLAEPVIPLVQPPDDPGAEDGSEPERDTRWQGRELFR
ncbi:MAG: heme biosynthesis HemY N-terminal domain-containing protein [Xanthobacteraceae bacterium]